MKIQTIEFPDVEPLESGELANDDRAEMVMPLVLAFRRAYYYHRMPGETEPSEPLDVVLTDLLADLLHLADRIVDANLPIGEVMLGSEDALAIAQARYWEEVQMEEEPDDEGGPLDDDWIQAAAERAAFAGRPQTTSEMMLEDMRLDGPRGGT